MVSFLMKGRNFLCFSCAKKSEIIVFLPAFKREDEDFTSLFSMCRSPMLTKLVIFHKRKNNDISDLLTSYCMYISVKFPSL